MSCQSWPPHFERIWENGDLSLCWQDCIMQPALLFVLLCVASRRLCFTVYRFPGAGGGLQAPDERRANAPYSLFMIAEILIAGVLLSMRLVILVAESLANNTSWVEAVDESKEIALCRYAGNICCAMSWLIIFGLLMIECNANKRPSRGMRLWWLFNLAVATMRLRTDMLALKPVQDELHNCTATVCLFSLVVRCIGYLGAVFFGFTAVFQRDTATKPPLSSMEESLLQEDTKSALDEQPERNSAEWAASFWSLLTFGWFTEILDTGAQVHLEAKHLHTVHRMDSSDRNFLLIKAAWDKQRLKANPSLFLAIHEAFGAYFWFSGFFKLLNDCVIFVGPVLINLIVNFIDDPKGQPYYVGYIYAGLIFLSGTFESLAMGQYFMRGFRQALRMKAAIAALVYHKSLRLSHDARREYGVGKIVSYMQIDADKLGSAAPYLHLTWSAPFQLTVAISLLWWQLGPSSMGGVVVLVIMMPINTMVARMQAKYTRKTMQCRDRRIKLTSEVIGGIRIVKMFAWEGAYMQRIRELRDEEMSAVKGNSLWGAFSVFLWGSTPLFVSVSTFALYGYLGNELTAAKAFTSLALFNVIRFPINALPMAVNMWISASVSNKRLFNFLIAEEQEDSAALAAVNDVPTSGYFREAIGMPAKPAISIRDGQFSWPDDSASGRNIALRGIELNVMSGSLVCVVGAVGAGKSTLLDAILNEVQRDSGLVTLNGSVAFCAQQPWIQNLSLRNNILFGQPFEQKRYDAVVEAVALEADFAMLPDGDSTEIGERGINLSGGQKARIALARACYHNSDVYILDDVLSAVDAHVGEHLMRACIAGPMLQGKTRVLATHALGWLSLADHIVILKDGQIAAQGSFEQLKAAGEDFGGSVDVQKKATVSPEGAPAAAAAAEVGKKAPGQAQKGALTTAEDRKKGMVAFRIWNAYASALGVALFAFIFCCFAVSQTSTVGSNVWLSLWSVDSLNRDASFYLTVYACLTIGAAVLVYARALAIAIATVRAGFRFHETVLWSILKSPVSFFDTTPSGRILNRLSQDQAVIDVQLRMTTASLFNCIFQVLGAFCAIVYATPYAAIAFVPVGAVYHRLQAYFRSSSRELQRLSSVSRSPIYESFTESLDGASTIRAFESEGLFMHTNQARLDRNIRAAFPAAAANRWLAVRLEFLGNSIVGIAACLAVLEADTRGHAVASGLAGLTLTYALSVTSILNWLLRTFTGAEMQMVAVERLIDWSSLTPEGDSHVPDEAQVGVTESWPSQGAISFKNVSMRYRAELDPVLSKVSFEVLAGESVGIVGRTGSGKSSLLVSLYRIAEIENDGGAISIDGINTTSVALETLRSRISIIPQDPTLFSGTLRSNMDPFNEHSDQEIALVLRQCSLHDYVMEEEDSKQPRGIEMKIEPNGENLSVGQRQLVCLGRALLRRSRIIVLDEATASVDERTDALIQKTLRSLDVKATMITIAHRINTIMDCDKVIVMHDGKVAEMGPPTELLKRDGGRFAALAGDRDD